MVTAPPDPTRPAKKADEPRDPDPRDAPADAGDDQPDFSAEFDHPSGRLEPVSKWEP